MTESTVQLPHTNGKAVVREILDRLPENATFPEIAEEIAIQAAFDEAEEDIREGRVYSNAEMKERARKWRGK